MHGVCSYLPGCLKQEPLVSGRVYRAEEVGAILDARSSAGAEHLVRDGPVPWWVRAGGRGLAGPWPSGLCPRCRHSVLAVMNLWLPFTWGLAQSLSWLEIAGLATQVTSDQNRSMGHCSGKLPGSDCGRESTLGGEGEAQSGNLGRMR